MPKTHSDSFCVFVETGRCWGRIVGEDSEGGVCDLCVRICPEVFEKPLRDDCARVRSEANPETYKTQVLHAARSCPVDAIRVTETIKSAAASKVYKWVPVIDEERCTGCGLCVEACGPKCLELANGVAVLARPENCGSEEHCIGPCQDDAIRMAWVPMEGDRSVGRWRWEVDDE